MSNKGYVRVEPLPPPQHSKFIFDRLLWHTNKQYKLHFSWDRIHVAWHIHRLDKSTQKMKYNGASIFDISGSWLDTTLCVFLTDLWKSGILKLTHCYQIYSNPKTKTVNIPLLDSWQIRVHKDCNVERPTTSTSNVIDSQYLSHQQWIANNERSQGKGKEPDPTID